MNLLLNYYRKTAVMALTIIATMVFAVSSNAALVNYSQNFEGLNRSSSTALGNDGWLVFANVFDTDKTTYLSDYGVYSAPNGGAGFSSILAGQGGTAQGAQQLTVFNDYSNTDHATGKWIETMLYQEQTISAADAGATLSFMFDAKKGYISGDSAAAAFIRTLDPGAGFATSNNISLNTTSLNSEWDSFTLNLLIPSDNSLNGQLLQFGFSTFAANYQGSDNFYDNINASVSSASTVPVPAAAWLFISGFVALAGLGRRKC
jgi:hypothetical protein